RKLDFAYDKLTFQGRMHREVALFPNHSFYHSELKQAYDIPNLDEDVKKELSRQVEDLNFKSSSKGDLYDLLSKKRMIFFQSDPDKNHFGKSNEQEAKLVVKIISQLKELYN